MLDSKGIWNEWFIAESTGDYNIIHQTPINDLLKAIRHNSGIERKAVKELKTEVKRRRKEERQNKWYKKPIIIGAIITGIFVIVGALIQIMPTLINTIKTSKNEDIINSSNAKLSMLRYLEQEIKDNIVLMQNFEKGFKEASKVKFRSIKQNWESIKVSFRTSDFWNKFISDFEDLEFQSLISNEYDKYITIDNAIKVLLEKKYNLIEKYAIDTNSYDAEFKKVKTRYLILNSHIQRCIGSDKSSEKCLEAIKRKTAEISATSTD